MNVVIWRKNFTKKYLTKFTIPSGWLGVTVTTPGSVLAMTQCLGWIKWFGGRNKAWPPPTWGASDGSDPTSITFWLKMNLWGNLELYYKKMFIALNLLNKYAYKYKLKKQSWSITWMKYKNDMTYNIYVLYNIYSMQFQNFV